MLYRVRFSVVVILFCHSVFTVAQHRLNKPDSAYTLTRYSHLLVDTSGQLSIIDIVNQNNGLAWWLTDTINTNFGLTQASIWLKASFVADTLPTSGWLAVCENNYINYLDFYLYNDKDSLIKQVLTGNMRPIYLRDIPHRHFPIHLPIEKGKNYTLYVRYCTDDIMQLQTVLCSYDTFFHKNYHLQFIEGMYFGCLFIMVFYNLFLLFATLSINYLYYVLYVTGTILLQLDLGGWLYEYTHILGPAVSSKLGVIWVGVMLFFSILFIETFIHKHHKNRYCKNCFFVIKLVAIMELMCGIFIPLKYNMPFILLFVTFFVVPVIMQSIIKAYINGQKSTRYLIFGWGAIGVGVTWYCLASLGILPFNFWAQYGIQIGTVVEILFLSFALADRINMLRVEKQEAQKEIIHQLQENTRLMQQLNHEQKRVFEAVLQGEENERKRLAVELHDGIGQLLSVVRLNVSSLVHSLKKQDKQTQDLVQAIVHLVDDSCREIRSISHNLMPNTVLQFGLVAALEEFTQKINRAKQIRAHFQNMDFNIKLEPHIETTLYRTVQEIVNNTLKHAQATDLYIQLIKEDNELIVLVEDNGTGFDTNIIKQSAKGLGIKNIISRIEYIKGRVIIDSAPKKGTSYHITVNIPSQTTQATK